ncbi:uncharacterized protein BYT42DRAFT_59287 [Radiomyces spectabilis]|uniref:uncharacterized protein n=1 Tax=Radiomyces spectabilis TaxID=64574 RepID=UPI002220D751|nr:uncharacterized protein BYT42DRAFT_59287 [Radiomyces spectabilis]KAI8373133.1 hypothetical protein BYT42DRAFT_59287 [Radiomyces spectabilis]
MADQSSRPLRRSARQRKPVSYGDTEVYEIAPKSTTATTSTRSSKAHGSKGSKVTTRTTRKRKTADVNVDTNLVGDSLQAESTTTRTTRKRKAPDSEDSKVTTTRTTRKRKAADANDDINLVGKSPQAESSIGTAIAANPRRSRRVCASKKNAQQKEEQEQPKKPTKRQGTRKATEPIVEEPAQVVTSTDAVTLNSPRTRRKGHRDLKEAADKKKPSQQKPKDQKQPNRKQQPKKQKDLERNRNQQQEVLERNQDQQQENLERNLNQQQEDLEDQLEEDDEEEQVEEDASEPEESAASFPTHIAEFLSRQGVPVDTGAHALETVVDLRDSGRITAFDGNQLMIQEALRLNEAMQQEAEAQLAWIDERLKMNETLSKTVREFAVRETVANRKRAEIHKKYPIQYQPFVDQQGQTPFDSLDLEEDSDDQTAYRTSKSRPWNMKERKALLGAIHTEARRNMALEFMAR